jgi:hypothetical protein
VGEKERWAEKKVFLGRGEVAYPGC